MTTIQLLAWIFLGVGAVSCAIVLADIFLGRYQHIAIMNITWPITALYSGPIGLFMYYMYGRVGKMNMHDVRKNKRKRKKPHWVHVFISATHCGGGCAIADIITEVVIFWAAIRIFGHYVWSSFLIDYGAALLIGFLFQYLSQRPMHPKTGFFKLMIQAVKADILSLTAFQVGMFSWLLAVYYIYNGSLNAGNHVYWFMMQIGLTLGLLTTFPVNAWLIKAGIKSHCG